MAKRRLTVEDAWHQIEGAVYFPDQKKAVRQVLRELAKAAYQRGYEMGERTERQSSPQLLEQAYHQGRVDHAMEGLDK